MQIPGSDTRVVELRVHGILGTTGSALTDSVASVDVAGDGVGRIVRPADRLRRPVPGPVLTTGDRTVPRIVEGYVWSRMTRGGLAKAAWALLFPFALANVADWMLPPSRDGSTLSSALCTVLRGLVRIAALLLTMVFVAQVAVASLDLLAAQCLRPGSGCMAYVPQGIRTVEFVRWLAGLLPVALVVVSLHGLSTVSWRVFGPTDASPHTTRAPILPGANVVADPDTPALRTLHVSAALSTVALLALGGPWARTTDPRWFAAAALTLLAMIATAVLDDPTGIQDAADTRPPHRALRHGLRLALVPASAILFLTVVVAPPRLRGPLPGSDSTLGVLTFLLLVTCLATVVLLTVAAKLAQPTWTRTPRELRPWAGGWMAAPVLMIACMLGTGFGAGFALCLREILGAPKLLLPRVYDDVTLFWGTATVLLAVALVVVLPWVLLDRWRATGARKTVPSEVALLHAGRRDDQHSAARAWWWAGLQRRYSHHLLLVIAIVLAASTCLSLAARWLGLLSPGWLTGLTGAGITMLIALAGGLLRMIFLAARRPEAARHLGVLCDLALFWPREAHPFVPPCYALKVVPELVERAREHLTDPNTRVVLVGHSQGSLLAAVAAARLLDSVSEADRERIGLVTAGSQLQWAYQRAFPGVVPYDSLRRLAGMLGGRWRALCRGTDPLGGAVTTWSRQVYDGMLIGAGFRADGTQGPLPPASRGPTGALVLGGDHWLPDPQRGPFASRRWVPGVRAHADYTGDPEWDRAVAMAAGLETPVRGSTLPLRTAALVATATEVSSAPATPTPQPSLVDPETAASAGAATDSGEAALDQLLTKPAEDSEIPRLELPEIIEPRGRVAPWERTTALRTHDR